MVTVSFRMHRVLMTFWCTIRCKKLCTGMNSQSFWECVLDTSSWKQAKENLASDASVSFFLIHSSTLVFFESVDHVPANVTISPQPTQLNSLDLIAGMTQILMKGRSPKLQARHKNAQSSSGLVVSTNHFGAFNRSLICANQ